MGSLAEGRKLLNAGRSWCRLCLRARSRRWTELCGIAGEIVFDQVELEEGMIV